MATFDEFRRSLEVDFGEASKGKKFEFFCKWFLENDPEWSKMETSQPQSIGQLTGCLTGSFV